MRKPSVSRRRAAGHFASALLRGSGLVVAWFSLVALLVVACSKETPAPAPASSAPSPIVVVSSPAMPASSPSEALWASGSVSASASVSTSASASASASVPPPTVTPPNTGKPIGSAEPPPAVDAGPKEFACGGGGKPKCPLQNWMNINMKPAMASGDPARVSATLRKIAAMAPPGYPAWAKIANDGAAEVDSKKDVSAAKPSCTKCHEQYKTKWKTEDRDRAI